MRAGLVLAPHGRRHPWPPASRRIGTAEPALADLPLPIAASTAERSDSGPEEPFAAALVNSGAVRLDESDGSTDHHHSGHTEIIWDTSESVGIHCECGWEYRGTDYVDKLVLPQAEEELMLQAILIDNMGDEYAINDATARPGDLMRRRSSASPTATVLASP